MIKNIKRLIPQEFINIYHFLIALLSLAYYRYPARKLRVVGVTGTDGKTTTASLIYHILKNSGKKVSLISTVGTKILDKEVNIPLHITTPDSFFMQKFLLDSRKNGVEFVVLEVSSHALDQNRLLGCNFEGAVFTNLTHDHLDYHHSFGDYRQTKLRLFNRLKWAILNSDDENYNYFADRSIGGGAKVFGYAINKKSNFQARNVRLKKSETFFSLITDTGNSFISSKLTGEFNVYNLLAALAVGEALGIPLEKSKEAIENFNPVEGRMNMIPNRKGLNIVIDYAHTPHALRQVLQNLRKIYSKGKLITVFGCVGERDSQKRPMMGQISTHIADVSIFTMDDARSEVVDSIIGQMELGAIKTRSHYYLKISSRSKAISTAIKKIAKRGDTIAILGMGHEKTISYNGKEHPWSDRKYVESLLK